MSLNPNARHGAEALSRQAKRGVMPIPKPERRSGGNAAHYTYAVGQHADCWFARFTETPCSGRLVRCHIIDKQVLRRAGADPWDDRAWVWGCGGAGHGNEGHHGEFDARRLIVARSALPAGVEELAIEIGAERRLYRRFGPLEAAA